MSKIDLSPIAGLPIVFVDGQLNFGSELGKISQSIRTIGAIKPVAAKPDAITQPEDHPIYYMYRDVAFPKEKERFKKANLRYDVTHIPAAVVGGELVKTSGHYHPGAWPELYEVLHGEAWYLLQRRDESNPKNIVEAYLVKVTAGQKVLMPPYFGHITINPGPSDLVMANWVSSQFSSDYSLYEQLHGGAYYLFADGNIKKNPGYDRCAQLKIMSSNQNSDMLKSSKGLPGYQWGRQSINDLDMLNRPKEYQWPLSNLFAPR